MQAVMLKRRTRIIVPMTTVNRAFGIMLSVDCLHLYTIRGVDKMNKTIEELKDQFVEKHGIVEYTLVYDCIQWKERWYDGYSFNTHVHTRNLRTGEETVCKQ